MAAKGDELLEIARQHNLNFLFEASVGGGIPILRPLDQCLAANEVYEIAGILNGTTNFMLTQMVENDMSFDDALSLAQRLATPSGIPPPHIDGDDACRKICILGLPGLWPPCLSGPGPHGGYTEGDAGRCELCRGHGGRNQAHRPGAEAAGWTAVRHRGPHDSAPLQPSGGRQ